MANLNYYEVHVTTAHIPRTSIFNLPYGYQLSCTRAGGWQLWFGQKEVASGFGNKDDRSWLKIDVDGHVILDRSEHRKEEE